MNSVFLDHFFWFQFFFAPSARFFQEIQQVRLTGSPANFEQIASVATNTITGDSETINYYAGTEGVVEFIGSAHFNQPGTKLSCAQIRHTIETGATSGQACSGSLSPQNN